MTRNYEIDCRDLIECDHTPETPVSDGGEITHYVCRCGQKQWADPPIKSILKAKLIRDALMEKVKGAADMTKPMRLCDAGVREQEWAQQMVKEGRLPAGVTFKDFLDHGVYDPVRDEVSITVKASTFSFRVQRA